MADQNWLETYRSYSFDELTAELQRLKAWSDPVSGQTAGEKSYTKDPGFAGRLSACTRALKEKSGQASPSQGIADFSRLRLDGGSPRCVPNQVVF